MSVIRYLTVLSVALSNYILAQNFQLGFRAEANLLQHHSGNYSETSALMPSIQLNGAYFLSNSLALEARLGAVLDPDEEYYSGWEYGLLAKYLMGQQANKAFIMGGAVIHTNGGGQHTLQKTFLLPALGFGVNVTGAFMLETLLLYGMNQTMGEYWSMGSTSRSSIKMDWVLKVGAGFSWNL